MDVTTRELAPELWPAFERLFGERGACGGCWCMSWRTAKGEQWEAIKGDEAKRRMRFLIESGQAHGMLAFVGDEPVGWCSFGRRTDYAKLDRAPSFKCDDADQVWSIPCFFVKKEHQGRGVGRVLLAAALKALEGHGATLVEGYPVKPPSNGKPLPAAFAWTGTRSLFAGAGFKVVGNPDGGKQRVRKHLSERS